MDKSTLNCSRCGRVFSYTGFGALLCASCKALDEEEFGKVRDFLHANGAANMYEISEATGVTEKTIKRFLLESRLEIPEGSPIYIQCMSCGCDIRSGKYCPECAARLSKELHISYQAYAGDRPKNPATHKTGKMRFIDLKRR